MGAIKDLAIHVEELEAKNKRLEYENKRLRVILKEHGVTLLKGWNRREP